MEMRASAAELIRGRRNEQKMSTVLGIPFKTAVMHRASSKSELKVHGIASVVKKAIRRELGLRGRLSRPRA